MKKRIIQYNEKLDRIIHEIRDDLSQYFEQIEYTSTSSMIQIINLKTQADFDNIYSGSGFYIILTDYSFEENDCSFSLNKQSAIYRGHSRYTKKRVLSHLLNERYNSMRKSGEPKYEVCLKIKEGVNGINIDEMPYKNWKWTLIVHKMRHSSKLIREQAEIAFDLSHGKPCKSRENY